MIKTIGKFTFIASWIPLEGRVYLWPVLAIDYQKRDESGYNDWSIDLMFGKFHGFINVCWYSKNKETKNKE